MCIKHLWERVRVRAYPEGPGEPVELGIIELKV